MKAVVWRGGQRYEVEELPDPHPSEEQVVVRIDVAPICGSDLHLEDFKSLPPVVPGHEASGTVVEAARSARAGSGLRPGDRVTLDPVQVCGSCSACTHGIPHLCTRCRHLGGETTPGTWAEYVAIDAPNAHRVPEGVSMESASLTEPAAVCYESCRRAGLSAGSSVVIIGDGPFGFLHAELAAAMGAGKLIVAGHHDERLRRIEERTGAAVCNTRVASLSRTVDMIVGAEGVDIVIEATGNPRSPGAGLPLLRPRGTLVLFSCIFNAEAIDLELVHMKELTIAGSCRSLDAFDTCLAWMAAGTIDPGIVLDLAVPIDRLGEAFDRLAEQKGSTFKVALLPGGTTRRSSRD